MGRTKPDSIELDPRPTDSHVAKTDQDTFGNVFRRNMPYGTVSDHGTFHIQVLDSTGPVASVQITARLTDDGGFLINDHGDCDAPQ